MTKAESRSANATKFKKSATKTNGDDVALAGILLGVGWLAGGPIGAIAGGALLAACYPVEKIGVEGGENNGGEGKESEEKLVQYVASNPVTIANDVFSNAQNVGLVWTGSEYGITWINEKISTGYPFGISFSRLDNLGNKMGEREVVDLENYAFNHALTWNESMNQYLLCAGTGTYCFRFDEKGDSVLPTGPIFNSDTDSFFSEPSVVWDSPHKQYGASWRRRSHDQRSGTDRSVIMFTRAGFDGNRMGQETQIGDRYSSRHYLGLGERGYTLSWVETDHNIIQSAYEGERLLKFSALNTQGSKIGESLNIYESNFGILRPYIFWRENEYNVIWFDVDPDDKGIYIAQINDNDLQRGDSRRVVVPHTGLLELTTPAVTGSVPGGYSVACSERECGVSWADQRDKNQELKFARFDSAWNRIGDVMTVVNIPSTTDRTPWAHYPSSVWTESEYGVAWMYDDFIGSSKEVQFARIAPTDRE